MAGRKVKSKTSQTEQENEVIEVAIENEDVVTEQEIIEAVSSKIKTLRVKFIKNHSISTGGSRTEYKRNETAEVEFHIGNLLANRNIATILG